MKKLKLASTILAMSGIVGISILSPVNTFASSLNEYDNITILNNAKNVVKSSQSSSNATNQEGINSGILGLKYNRNQVLAVNGDTIQSFVPREGKNAGEKFIVVERKKKSLTTAPVDISIVDSVNDRTYPGALQLADEAFVDNRPTLLMVKRKPINLSIDLPGLKGENTVTVDNPTYGNVSGAIDGLVSKWNEKYSSTHTLPARTQYSESMVYSKSQIASALNVNSKVLENSLE